MTVRSKGTQVSRAPTFADPELESELDERGFVVIDLLSDDILGVLVEIADRVYVDERHGFHASNLSGAHEYRHEVYRELRPVLEPLVSPFLVDHEPYTASLLMKWPDPDSAFHTHQDWTMVDESRYRTINVWCPLTDTDARNGALRVLPGSHRVLRAVRCSPMPPTGCESPGWKVGWEEMEPVEMRAGQALVFDHALLHSSGPNLSGSPRHAVAVAFKPRAADLFHWYLPDPRSRELEVFSVDSDFFADIDIGSRPDAPVVGSESFGWEPITKPELLRRCGRAVEPSGSTRPVLRDLGLETELTEKGWTVVHLLDPTEVAELVAWFDGADHELVLDRSFASGFHATIMDGREQYRQAAHDAIVGVVQPHVDSLFEEMRTTLTNWLYKAPGSAAVPRHVDWSFVDEDRHRSVSVWVPLVDTDEDHGCIGVVTGSHRQVEFVRASTRPTYQETEAFGASLPGHELVPLLAGHAVIFDHRLVHFSAPHCGDEPRLAVTWELVPREADLVHFEQLGPGRFLRHVVEPSFFISYTAGDDPTTVPGHLSVSEVEAPSFDQFCPVESTPSSATPPDPPVDPAPRALLVRRAVRGTRRLVRRAVASRTQS